MRGLHPVFVALSVLFRVTCFADEDFRSDDDDSKIISPSLHDTLQREALVEEGSQALLTCVVRNLGNHTLIWKYRLYNILTAGTTRVTTDERFSVLHDPGGDVYVLSIANVSMTDSGVYTCEINTQPKTMFFHKLRVFNVDIATVPSELTTVESMESLNISKDELPTVSAEQSSNPLKVSTYFDYTSCCKAGNVSSMCLDFCNIGNILEGNIKVNPVKCESQFPHIVDCMADGRDHTNCCTEAGVPDLCQDICKGDYTVQTDDIRTHIACSDYTPQTIACIAKGIDILPGPPIDFELVNVTSDAFTVSWRSPNKAIMGEVKGYELQISLVRVMNSNDTKNLSNPLLDKTAPIIVKVNASSPRVHTFTNLNSLSYYYVTIKSYNDYGASLPSYRLKVLTEQIDGEETEILEEKRIPLIPPMKDTLTCCRNRNITNQRCLNAFCDPLSFKDKMEVADMMICAPWINTMMSCVGDGVDHTPCCRRRNVQSSCQGFCNSETKQRINFKHFICLEEFKEIGNCMMESYNVLPSEPTNFRFSNIGPKIGLLHWDSPAERGETVVEYEVYYLKISHNVRKRDVVVKRVRSSPFVVEDLDPDSSYEVYVKAVNFYGSGRESTRIVFRTAKAMKERNQNSYDLQTCCDKSGLTPPCGSLCAYNASMRELTSNSKLCRHELPKIFKCFSGWRDHLPCCARRGVPVQCQLLCQGVMISAEKTFETCVPYIGNIVTCLEEGTLLLPAPVINFHVIRVDDDAVKLGWDKSPEYEDVFRYEIYYHNRQLNNSKPVSPFEHDANVNTTEDNVTITGLMTGFSYRFFIVARNGNGTSLPSSIISLNVSSEWWASALNSTGGPMAKQSHPHSLEIARASTTTISLSWAPPAVSNPDSYYKYKLYIREVTSTSNISNTFETHQTFYTLRDLKPNTRYIIYATAHDHTLESDPSETVIAWTDPVVPAFAEIPTVHPSGDLAEGENITVLCIAMGSPSPNVTLYLGGRPLRSKTSRHMVTNIFNITRDMKQIGCYASNGYSTPMMATRILPINYRPYIKKIKSVETSIGDEVTVTCTIDASPMPTVSIGRDGKTLTVSDRVEITPENVEQTGLYTIKVHIKKAEMIDNGSYYCRANNSLGVDKKEFHIGVMASKEETRRNYDNIDACCDHENVTSSCRPLCTRQLDLDYLLLNPDCIPELHKFMRCAADGSDHRYCCRRRGVPKDCLNWCKGMPIEREDFCALTHARSIGDCLHEGAYTLPGLPRNVEVTPLSAGSAIVHWDPPKRNPESVETYSVMFRKVGDRFADKISTPQNEITLRNLTPGVTYELFLEAGNYEGSSLITPAIKFITADEYIISPTTVSTARNDTTIILSVLFAVLCFISITAFWCIRHKTKFLPSNMNGGSSRSFENPFFNREVSMSHLQNNDSVSGHEGAETVVNGQNPPHPLNTLYKEVEDSSVGFKFQRLN